jgi:hypothetical protein
MAEFSTGALTSAGSTTLPLMSLYAAAGTRAVLREIGITNTTDTSLALKLVRLSTQGTPGTGLTEEEHDPDASPPLCTAFNTHSGTPPTLGNDLGYRAHIAAAKGAGVVWVKGSRGIIIPVGTANGVGVIVENGTGQACQIYFVWEE